VLLQDVVVFYSAVYVYGRSCVAVCCRVLQCVVTGCCSVLQCCVCVWQFMFCSVLQYVAVCCSMLLQGVVTCYKLHSAVYMYGGSCGAVCCSVLQCVVAGCCSVLQRCVCRWYVMCCSILQSVAVCCSVLRMV